MAGLNFADSHNMVAYLEKSTENADFAEIVDFLNANPTRNLDSSKKFLMYPRFLQLFLNKQIENLSEVNAVYDTPSYTKKIFANMRRQGKDFSGTVTPLFSFMLAQQVDMGEGSGQPTDPQHTSTTATPSQVKPITVLSSSQPKKTHRPRKAKRATEISQSSGPIPLVADETVTKEWEDRMERAATTASSLEAEQDSGSGPRCQDTILGDAEAQTRFETASKQSNNLPLSRVNTLRSGEDRLKLKELMELYTKLSDKVLNLETTKTTQAMKIANLKQKIKNLEGKRNYTAGTEVKMLVTVILLAGLFVSTANVLYCSLSGYLLAEQIRSGINGKRGGEVRMKESGSVMKDYNTISTHLKNVLKGTKVRSVEQEEERLAKKREEDANIAEWDDVQAIMDADYELAVTPPKLGRSGMCFRERYFIIPLHKS
ncbi:hypothetical protein Tco_0504853 [Tanacetum coccineum]